ncbi:MAG: hypothetical protein H0V50_02825 [Thermoleophilaceae bacterium]|nr:hypothetical protein [Thermoleophilaceae bacterium]
MNALPEPIDATCICGHGELAHGYGELPPDFGDEFCHGFHDADAKGRFASPVIRYAIDAETRRPVRYRDCSCEAFVVTVPA